MLDYYIILALSNAYYYDFDDKSVEFVNKGLDIIEEKFIGHESVEIEQVDPISNETNKTTVNYFKAISTYSKVYNKVLIKCKQPKLNFRKALEEVNAASSSDSSEEESKEKEEITDEQELIEEESASEEEEQ